MGLEKEINEIKKKLENHEKRIIKLENPSQAKSAGTGKKISIKEFILLKKPKNDVQRTLALGYFFEKNKHLSSFNENDLKKGFRTAKEKIPINVGDKVQKNIKQGYIMEAERKKDNLKAWILTNSGEKFVENDFQKQG